MGAVMRDVDAPWPVAISVNSDATLSTVIASTAPKNVLGALSHVAIPAHPCAQIRANASSAVGTSTG